MDVESNTRIPFASSRSPIPTISKFERLPLELSRCILHLAADHDDALFALLPSPSPSREALDNRISLSLVSKGWREITLEALFYRLVVDLATLRGRIRKHDMINDHNGGSPHLIFQHVRQLKLVGDSPHYCTNAEDILPLFARLSRLITYQHHVGNYPALFGTMFTECGNSLRYLEVENASLLPINFGYLLSVQAPHLRYLDFGARNNEDEHPFIPSNISLASLHTLKLRYTNSSTQEPFQWQLPDLERVELYLGAREPDQISLVSASLPDSSTQALKRLDIPNGVDTSLLQSILDQFPCLDNLCLPCVPRIEWKDLEGCFSQLRKIGLAFSSDVDNGGGVEGFDSGEGRAYVESMLGELADRRRFPAVDCVYLFGFEKTWWNDGRLEEWSAKLAVAGILIERPCMF